MLLVLDIGNTNITLGIYDENRIVDTLRLVSDKTFSVNLSAIFKFEKDLIWQNWYSSPSLETVCLRPNIALILLSKFVSFMLYINI